MAANSSNGEQKAIKPPPLPSPLRFSKFFQVSYRHIFFRYGDFMSIRSGCWHFFVFEQLLTFIIDLMLCVYDFLKREVVYLLLLLTIVLTVNDYFQMYYASACNLRFFALIIESRNPLMCLIC